MNSASTKVIVWIVLKVSISCFSQADIVLKAGNVQVTLTSSYSWTVAEILWKDRAVLENIGSGQGTVILIQDNPNFWAGSFHHNETVLELRLRVNGEAAELNENGVYTGEIIEFYRRTILADVFILSSTLTISEDKIQEEVIVQGINPNKVIQVAYGFLGSRANRFSEFYGYKADGVLLLSGMSNKNNNAIIDLKPSIAVCQYDPKTFEAVLSTVVEGADSILEQFIWDRWWDNKLYARFRGLENDANFTRYYVLRQQMDFFQVDRAELHQHVNKKLFGIFCPKRMPEDLNQDCQVDLDDFMIFAKRWLECLRPDCN